MLRADRAILPRRHPSGRWLVVGLFVVGGIVLAGFYLARAILPPPPKLPTSRPTSAPVTKPFPTPSTTPSP